ncbi:exodeoxyribonuclease VII small subunit [soil metagenome]
MADMPAPEKISLEQTVARLEAIVEELESGDADLEKSIGLFAEGKKLGSAALKKLDALERRIQIVVQDDGDKMVTEDFEREGE